MGLIKNRLKSYGVDYRNGWLIHLEYETIALGFIRIPRQKTVKVQANIERHMDWMSKAITYKWNVKLEREYD